MSRFRNGRLLPRSGTDVVNEVAGVAGGKGRGAKILAYLKELLGRADSKVTRGLQQIDPAFIVGADPMVQGKLSRAAMSAIEHGYLPLRNIGREKPLNEMQKLTRASEIVSDPRFQTALRFVPGAATAGTLALGGAALDAVTESEEERNLRMALELLQRGY